MHRVRSAQRFAAWLALLAVVLLALAPTLSHALRNGPDLAGLDVCTTQGARPIGAAGVLDAAATKPWPALGHVFEHCPYCALQIGAFALAAPSLALALQTVEFELAGTLAAAPRGQAAWSAAQPRAPPRRC